MVNSHSIFPLTRICPAQYWMANGSFPDFSSECSVRILPVFTGFFWTVSGRGQDPACYLSHNQRQHLCFRLFAHAFKGASCYGMSGDSIAVRCLTSLFLFLFDPENVQNIYSDGSALNACLIRLVPPETKRVLFTVYRTVLKLRATEMCAICV